MSSRFFAGSDSDSDDSDVTTTSGSSEESEDVTAAGPKTNKSRKGRAYRL